MFCVGSFPLFRRLTDFVRNIRLAGTAFALPVHPAALSVFVNYKTQETLMTRKTAIAHTPHFFTRP
jgi:hypothetical protein